MRPTRFDLMLQYAREFIVEWFDQNPLGQIGIVGMRAGLGERIGEMSGNCLRTFGSFSISLIGFVKEIHRKSLMPYQIELNLNQWANRAFKIPSS